MTSDKYFDPEINDTFVKLKFHAISPTGIDSVNAVTPDDDPQFIYRIVSNDWGEWAD
jgi:hypothetical protein